MTHRIFTILFIIICIMMSSCSEDLMDTDVSVEPTTQRSVKKCSSKEHMSHLLDNPSYKKAYLARMATFEKQREKGLLKMNCSSPIKIPVAIHYQGVNAAQSSCLIDMAKDQIARVNRDFQAKNTDLSKWNNVKSTFSGVEVGEMCIEFVIADQNHPAGYGLATGQPAITFNKVNGDQANQWSGYLNIFVMSGTGSLGYAPLGGAGDGDGVVIDFTGFGAGSGCGSVAPNADTDLGRTLTHEIGHYLLLDHIWGDGCGTDDDVADTPDQANDRYGCPQIGVSSCGSPDLHMNYMDYTDDACMYMFTAGQVSRMTSYLLSNLSNIINKASVVYSGSSGGSDDNGDNPDDNDDTPDVDPEVCETPTDISVTIRNASSVKVDWSDISDAKKYRIRYRKQGSNKWKGSNTSKSHKTINNLSETIYEYQVRTRCPSGWTSWSPKTTFDLSQEDETPVGATTTYRIEVTLDDYGSETSWELYDESGQKVSSDGPYADGTAGETHSKEVALSEGCYTLEVYDDYGDGICCDYGDGSIQILTSDGELIAESDGRYGSYDYIDLCITTSTARMTGLKRDPKRKSRGKKK